MIPIRFKSKNVDIIKYFISTNKFYQSYSIYQNVTEKEGVYLIQNPDLKKGIHYIPMPEIKNGKIY